MSWTMLAPLIKKGPLQVSEIHIWKNGPDSQAQACQRNVQVKTNRALKLLKFGSMKIGGNSTRASSHVSSNVC